MCFSLSLSIKHEVVKRPITSKLLLPVILLVVALSFSVWFINGWQVTNPGHGQVNRIYVEAIPAPKNFTVQGSVAENTTISTGEFHYVVVMKNPNDFSVPYSGVITVILKSNSTGAIIYSTKFTANSYILAPRAVSEVYSGNATVPTGSPKGMYVLMASASGSADLEVISEQIYVALT